MLTQPPTRESEPQLARLAARRNPGQDARPVARVLKGAFMSLGEMNAPFTTPRM